MDWFHSKHFVFPHRGEGGCHSNSNTEPTRILANGIQQSLMQLLIPAATCPNICSAISPSSLGKSAEMQLICDLRTVFTLNIARSAAIVRFVYVRHIDVETDSWCVCVSAPTTTDRLSPSLFLRSCGQEEPTYSALWGDNKAFDEVIISPAMLNEHMPHMVMEGLNKVCFFCVHACWLWAGGMGFQPGS